MAAAGKTLVSTGQVESLTVAFSMRILCVKVRPNAKQQSMRQEGDGTFIIHLKSPPVDGKANQELIQLLAKELGVSKAAIRIKSGSTSKLKRIEIDET